MFDPGDLARFPLGFYRFLPVCVLPPLWRVLSPFSCLVVPRKGHEVSSETWHPPLRVHYLPYAFGRAWYGR